MNSFSCHFAATACFLLSGSCLAADNVDRSHDDEFHAYAVNVVKSPKPLWTGYGIYLGSGRVITAAHVSEGRADPSVVIDGVTLDATYLIRGAFEGVDVSLLAVDERLVPARVGLRRMELCDTPALPGQDVAVAVPEGVAHSRILPPKLLPKVAKGRFETLIADVATTGNSGSGVFDTVKGCLMGIMSRKIQVPVVNVKDARRSQTMVDFAKYFVPAAEIKAFLDAKSPAAR
jgi:hypothetical protein